MIWLLVKGVDEGGLVTTVTASCKSMCASDMAVAVTGMLLGLPSVRIDLPLISSFPQIFPLKLKLHIKFPESF